ncbi:MAG: GntR family transcriptional regulator [Ilumatobacter sp.]|uniref:GntR family transcriptional regulator n=1 Tax=Ilumatobacter sp. TaxID=1967498 RepID=UPI003C713681
MRDTAASTRPGMDLNRIPGYRPSLADEAYATIVEAVLNRQIELGDALIMDQLAELLDISRTPVRDALMRLEHEGLVEQRGRRGYVVREIGDDEVIKLYQAREAVEGHAARLVAEAGDDEAIDRIEQAIRQAQASMDGTIVASYQANRAVHRSILEAVGNRFMTISFDNIWGVSVAAVAYGRLYEPKVDDHDLVADHARLVVAIRGGDGDRAAAEAITHIRDGLEINLS